MGQRNEDRTLRRLVGSIYDAVERPELWDGVLEDLATILNASGMVLFVTEDLGTRVGFLKTLGIPQTRNDDYRDYYVQKDVLMHRSLTVRQPAGLMMLFQEFYPDAKLQRSEFFNDFLQTIRFRYGAGGTLRYDGGNMSAIAAWRPEQTGTFEQRDLDFLSLLAPHFQRAIQLHRELFDLRQAKQAAMEVLDHLPMAVLLLDGRGRVLSMNRSARDIVAKEDGLTVDRSGLCRAAKTRETAVLRRLIRGAARTGDGEVTDPGGVTTLSRSTGLRPYQVLVSPLGDGALDPGATRAAAAVFLFDPEARPEPPAELLSRLYGLTPMEARLAVALAGGTPMKQAAEALAITDNTARGYLKQVFFKTGCNRQTDLVRMLLTGPFGINPVHGQQ